MWYLYKQLFQNCKTEAYLKVCYTFIMKRFTERSQQQLIRSVQQNSSNKITYIRVYFQIHSHSFHLTDFFKYENGLHETILDVAPWHVPELNWA